jgi:hypothetical protein
MAGLPADLRDRLNSTDPSVRGEALVDALALGAVSTTVVAKLPRVASRIGLDRPAAGSGRTIRIDDDLVRHLEATNAPPELIDVVNLSRRSSGGASIVVIGRKTEKVPDTLVAKDWRDHEVLDIPDTEWSPDVNDIWVSGVIARKQPIYIASPLTRENLWNAYREQPTVFAIEYQRFLNAGYKHIGDYLVPPK